MEEKKEQHHGNCPVCKGTGKFSEPQGNGEYDDEATCQVCNGTGNIAPEDGPPIEKEETIRKQFPLALRIDLIKRIGEEKLKTGKYNYAIVEDALDKYFGVENAGKES